MAGNIDSGRSAFTMFVIGTFFCLAVDLDLFTAAVILGRVCDRVRPLFPEAFAAGLVRTACRGAGHFDGSSGTELILVVNTGDCAAVKNCHDYALLVLFSVRQDVIFLYTSSSIVTVQPAPFVKPHCVLTVANTTVWLNCYLVFVEKQKIFKKHLTLYQGHDIVIQNVKTKQSSALTSAHIGCGSGLYAHMVFPCISGYNWVRMLSALFLLCKDSGGRLF